MTIQNMPYSWIENLSTKITDLHASGCDSEDIFYQMGFSADSWPGGMYCTPEYDFIKTCIGEE